jgi:homoserine kinase
MTLRIRVPCSTSNLGSGFDCVGLALDRHLEVEFVPADSGGLRIQRTGTLSHLRSNVSGDAVAAAFVSVRKDSGRGDVHGTLRMTSAIPVGRGLGSSAAATVAGLVLGRVVEGDDVGAKDILSRATRIEGHPDNAAPALFGGLVGIVADDDGVPRPFPLPLSANIGFAYAAPPVEVSTAAARQALPGEVPQAVAVRALSRVAALVRGLANGDAALLHSGFEDEIHVPWRLPLIPGARQAMQAARDAGAWAVTISGSGSGLIALMPAGGEEEVALAMRDAFANAMAASATAGDILAFALTPDRVGVRIDTGTGWAPLPAIAGFRGERA